jgi:hypothetical protein
VSLKLPLMNWRLADIAASDKIGSVGLFTSILVPDSGISVLGFGCSDESVAFDSNRRLHTSLIQRLSILQI